MITVSYVRTSAIGAAPMTVGCTYCLAQRGSRCQSKGGYRNSAVGRGGFHKARHEAVAHLTDDQKYDAYAEMRAEEAQLRERVSRRLAQPLTPQQQEVRRRTGEAWVRAGREATEELRSARSLPKPLAPIRGAAPVADLAAERARRRGGPTSGGAA